MKKILVATDGSPNSGYALEQALDLAKAGAAKLVVVDMRHAPPWLGEPFCQHSLSAESRHACETGALAVARALAADVEAELEVLEGDPAERIVELARLRDVDLVVVGSRGLGAMAGLLLRSVSRHLRLARRYAARTQGAVGVRSLHGGDAE